jgi:dUTPase
LSDDFLPTRSEPKATGWDVRCAEKDGVILKPFQKALINLGFKAFCPFGWWAELKPRSSAFGKKALHCLYGTIDERYSNKWLLAVQWIPPTTEKDFEYKDSFYKYVKDQELKIDFGERIGQIIPVYRQEMIVSKITTEEFERLCSQRDGNRDGFGSSGDK